MTSSALWRPSAERTRTARISAYQCWLADERQLHFGDYAALHAWSTRDGDAFWRSVWDYFGIAGQGAAVADPSGPSALAGAGMPGATWFPQVRLNYVDQVFRHATPERPAVVAGDESGALEEVSWGELQRRVAALAASLRERGVAPGDRVAAYLPNRVEAVVAFLASASIGAVWSVCSPDMGTASALDRLRQIEPKVLIATDSYRFGGKAHDRREVVAALRSALTSLRVFIPVQGDGRTADTLAGQEILPWQEAIAGQAPLQVEPVAFGHPLWIVYSSGTTGLPKPIVHGHGGIVLEHSKLLALHNDLGPIDRFLWYSSTGWIMWNCQMGGLLLGATICLYDGSPGFPDLNALWNFADRAGATFVGSGAAFYMSCMKAGIGPRAGGRLPALRTLGSTGSPLAPDVHQWLQQGCGDDVWIAPISGGTDIASAFVGGNCTLPVQAGEMQCVCLGAGVEAWSEDGRPLVGQVGELVCTTPMPSMPLFFWNDPDGRRLRDSYFDTFPGVWRHGDWLEITERGGAIIYGRSDATINRHGIRMGTSELYSAVEALDEIGDALVVDLEFLGRESYMPLFVVMKPGAVLDDALKARITQVIRQALTPKHVPNDIFQVPEVPRTLTGKKLEVPIKRLLLGESLARVVNLDAVANRGSLRWFEAFAETRRGGARPAATASEAPAQAAPAAS